jgi:tRNA G18 (ribose-2'-O)-methylase SpoU
MQVQGYTIVAVEQTVNSQSLYEFQFPEKTLLLLGYGKFLCLCLN